jgi:hypothetical protein
MTMVVEPYESVGALQFGMRQDEIVAAIGEPQRITKNYMGNSQLWYDDNKFNVVVEGDRLAEVVLSPSIEMSIRGINPFTDPTGFASLCRLDGSPCEALGFIVLRNLGIALTGFHDKDESQKALTAFARGRLDIVESQMKPFPVP